MTITTVESVQLSYTYQFTINYKHYTALPFNMQNIDCITLQKAYWYLKIELHRIARIMVTRYNNITTASFVGCKEIQKRYHFVNNFTTLSSLTQFRLELHFHDTSLWMTFPGIPLPGTERSIGGVRSMSGRISIGNFAKPFRYNFHCHWTRPPHAYIKVLNA